MSAAEHPGFRHLADEDDDPAWRSAPERPRETRAASSDIGPMFGIGAAPKEAPAAPSRRVSPVILGGGLAVITAALLATPLLLHSPSHPTSAAAPSLRITHHQPAETPVTPHRSLPCYVNGVSVGALPLMDCAARNGVASGALDVGLQRPSPTPATAAPLPVQVAQASPPAIPEAAPSAPAPAPEARRRAAERPAPPAPERMAAAAPSDHGWRRAFGFFQGFAERPHPVEALPRTRLATRDDRAEPPIRASSRALPGRPAPHASSLPSPSRDAELRRHGPDVIADDVSVRDGPDEQGPTAAESALAANDFYRALGRADGARAASLVVPEKRHGGPLSSQAIDRFYSSLRAPLRVTSLRPLDNHHVAVRYQFVDPDGMLCSGDSEVATTVRDERVLVQSIHTHSRC